MTWRSILMDDRRAVAATEFALVLPFLVTLYLGGYQLTDGVSAYRKVTTTSRTLADLASQYTAVSDSDLDTVLNASTQVLTPYKSNNGTFLISQIKIDANTGAATVDWSRGLNVSGLTPGSTYNVPTAIKIKGTYLIVATVNYTYTPIAASGLIGTIPMRETVYMSPRAVAQVKKT